MKENPLAALLPDGGFCAIFRKIGCIGDSLSSGEFESRMNNQVGYHDYYEYSWGQFMARTCGATAYNFSRGGLTAKGFLERMQNGEERFTLLDPMKKCQAYIVALGVNDISGILRDELKMGTIEDVHADKPEKNAPTFAGYMGRILSSIKQAEHKARIFLVTIPRSDNEGPRLRYNDEHANLIYALAEKFPFTYVLDLRKYAPVYDAEFKKMYFLSGHMNPMGYLFTAKMFMTYIDAIIRSRPEEFAQVGFIGQENNLHNENFLW